MKTKLTICFVCTLWLASRTPGISTAHAQGSLTPPGVPAPTMKTLAQVEPRTPISSPITISSPGSYYLTGNLGQFAGSFLVIASSDVTLDLNGFNLSQGDTGLYVNPGLHNVAIRNGSLEYSGVAGITAASPVTVDSVDVFNCTSGYGMTLTSNSIIRNCKIFNNAGNGIQVGDNCVMESLVVTSNAGTGILAGNQALIKDCVAVNNTAFGISAAGSCRVTDCVTRNNGTNNIQMGFEGVITHCMATSSRTGSGIVFLFGTATGCSSDNNSQFGIDASQRSVVDHCDANSNGQSGIRVDYVGTVRNCSCDANAFCGILSDAGGFTIILNNNCTENGTSSTNNGAGIRVINAGGHRIEGNNVGSNYRGIDAQSSRNIILRNTALVNTSTNYNIAAGNSFGPIVNVAGVGDISGTANANHPAANFQF